MNRILKSLIIKECKQIIRDPSSIMIAFVLPLVLILIFAYGVNLDTSKSKVGIFNEDMDAKELISGLNGTRQLEIFHYTDRKSMENDMITKKIVAMVIIPNNFSKKLKDPNSVADIQVITDGTETNSAIFTQNYILGAIMNWQGIYANENGQATKPLINVTSTAWFNEELNSLHLMLPGSISTIMTLIGILLTALVIAREWERGTMESLLTTKVKTMDIVLGKYIPYYLLTIISTILCCAICVWGFGVPFKGSFLVFLVSGSLFIFCALGQGLLISVVTKNQFLACIIASIIGLMPSMMLSGYIYEISSMPKILQFITYFVPSRYFTPCVQNLFLAETIWNIIIPQSFYLLVTAVIYFIIVYKKTGKKLE